ncbi:ABC transporter ATP-binding protein [Eggerthella sp. YY7918]|uniref:ABC transporter ATP-binding protein n=1 Tax=Eggerthella sp. (strain YY7918) TaxID=502558 RepID=UPI0002171163|nr:ABC transporter ATP-binding protein [Eggerthella sp. YY7918]BAK44688.1 hypothetical protein EGYY_15480 [Eggerthella sp. YY7918]
MIDSLIRIIRWTGPHKKRLFLGCVCSFLMTWATAAPVVIGAWLLARVVEDSNGDSRLDPSWVWLSFLAIVACVLLRFVFSYGKNRLQESIGYEVAPEDRIRIGNVLKRVPMGFFSEVNTGDILTLATTELGVLELQGMKMVDAVINGYVNLVAIICFLLFVSPPAALAAILGTAISCFALASINRTSKRLTPVAHEATEKLAEDIIEYVRGLGTAKSYGQSGAAEKPILRSVKGLKEARIAIEFGFTPKNVIHLIAFKLASVGVVGCAVWGFVTGSLPLWSFFALLAFSFTIFSGVEKVNDSAHMLGDLGDILDRLEKVENAKRIDENGQEIALSEYDIEFQNVTFSYGQGEKTRKVLDQVNLSVPEGSTCAIVGPSGSGKTTIANLMMRFWDVDTGRILVGGRDVRELTCDSLLRNFSAVFQSVYLFNDTIENNIRFGKPGATEEEVRNAAHRARVDEFAEMLPDGYNTMVGEGGAALSGGQKQRISIARALLKDAPIVILDEATASIDPENESLIQAALTELTYGKTVVVIAHRLATIEHADQILVVDRGRIAQRGTHQQLLEHEGIYRRFVEIRSEAEGWSFRQ